MAVPQIYVLMGAKGSEQFQIVSDLIEFGATEDERSVVFYSTGDAAAFESDFQVKNREATGVAYEAYVEAFDFQIPEGTDLVFIVADGLEDPANFMEGFQPWLLESGCELARVITLVNCELAFTGEHAIAWYDGCIHFSDVVLLGGRANVTNRQVQDFLDRYEEKCFPCLFEYVKKGRVGNPALILDPQPRRITMIFDKPIIFEDDGEEEIEEEAMAGDLERDPYLKRIADGIRVHPLPSIAEILGA